jgi:predicted DNA-binding antitoxin AbrB/MazE fold protein
MLLVGSGIDAMVATFRQVGVFKPKEPVSVQSNVGTERKIIVDFLNDLKQIVRAE